MAPDSTLMGAARSALATVFGFADFRPGQADVLAATFAGEDVLAVMPTGSGKSLLFQLPAIVRGGLTLVVSPLIALMRDQVAQLREAGVEAASLNSSSDPDERRRVARGLDERSLRLLYIAPERLLRDDMVAALSKAEVDLLAIDEAHCVSQWGHDFRPEYLRLREVAEALRGVQTIAVTATADAPTRAEIAERLFVRDPRVFVRSFDRPNLFLAMRPKADATRQLIARLEGRAGETGIVYCASRRRTEELAAEFVSAGRRALPYHAGLDHGAARPRPRTPFSARTIASSARPSPSAWGSTSPTSASSFTPTCPPRSKPIIRRSAGRGATACPPTRSRFTARATSSSGGARFSKAPRPRRASASR